MQVKQTKPKQRILIILRTGMIKRNCLTVKSFTNKFILLIHKKKLFNVLNHGKGESKCQKAYVLWSVICYLIERRSSGKIVISLEKSFR